MMKNVPVKTYRYILHLLLVFFQLTSNFIYILIKLSLFIIRTPQSCECKIGIRISMVVFKHKLLNGK